MDADQIVERVTTLLAPLAADQGAMVDGVTYNDKSTPPVLMVTVAHAKPSESLKSDQVADLARLFSKALDDDDPIEPGYTLEVSTPGAESAIKTEAQWLRAVGKTVRVTHTDRDKTEGVLTAVESDAVVVETADGSQTIPFSKIKSARGVAQVPKES